MSERVGSPVDTQQSQSPSHSQLDSSGRKISLTEGDPKSCELERQDIEYLRSEWDEINVSSNDTTARITVQNYVGIIGLPSGTTLSIQSKIDCELLYLLAYTGEIDEELIYDTEDAGFETGSDLERVLAQLFVSELQRIVKRGLQQEYHTVESDEKHLRGQLQVHTQLQRQGPQPTRFECRYSELTYDTPLNQVVLAATAKMCRWLEPSPLQSELLHYRELLRQQVSEVPVSQTLLDSIELSHLQSHYKRILPLAELILSEEVVRGLERPDKPFPSLVFDMPTVFESVLVTATQEVLADSGVKVTENDLGELARTTDDSEKRKLEPDLVFRDQDDPDIVLAVGDAKWKTSSSVSRDDLYQIATYQAHHETPGILLYPDEGPAERTYEYTQGQASYGPLLIGRADVTNGRESEMESEASSYEEYIATIETSLESLMDNLLF
ncbi:McrC family protein [Halostagnicola kamekurae]|uniref:McrBC 5-methylcytosine restriction system component n=1 Tax=Halostagnicola kamekurae TaxID=619731 RepID=A0A1I6UST7_9EURY|nr:hypothetical protein [Halostagnicola kamekurae]SFT04515.1 McrBC 5-methylcytosine restriction system component [Halostagnicola kamekurae]